LWSDVQARYLEFLVSTPLSALAPPDVPLAEIPSAPNLPESPAEA